MNRDTTSSDTAIFTMRAPTKSTGRNARLRVLRTGLIAVAIAGGCFALWQWREKSSKPMPHAMAAVPVHIASSEQADVPIYVTGLGTVQASNTVTIRSRVDGALDQVRFTEGQDVKRGDLLAVIDPRPFQAALDQAVAKSKQDQAALANARLILDRDAQLASQGYTTQETFDTQKSTVQQLEAAVSQDEAAISNARTQLSYTQITAPIDGRTGIRLVDVGNIIHATDATGIVVITTLRPIDVIATFADGDLPAVRGALRTGPVQAVACSRDGTRQLDSGTLTLFDNQIDQNSATIRLKASFPNAEEALWPGQFVLLQIRTNVARDAVVVPSGAIQRGANGFYLYVVGSDDRAELRPVKVGQIADGRSIIADGLKAGERVVVSGQYRLAPGISVTTTETQNPTDTGRKS